MRGNKTIRKTVAFFLLMVFAITAAPKAYFHDVFANHVDKPINCLDNKTAAHLHENGINCHFDQLVVSSLFHFAFDDAKDKQLSFLENDYCEVLPFFSTCFHTHFTNRGPPAA